MKQKLVPIVLTISLLANVVLVYALVHQREQEESLHKVSAVYELSVAVQCLERYQESRRDSDYMEAVACFRGACDQVESLRDVDYSVTTEPFQSMYTLALGYPDTVKENLEEVVVVLSQINSPDVLTDRDSMEQWKAYTKELFEQSEDHP